MSTLYKTSDFLKDRHPYREKSFRQRIIDDQYKVFNGYGEESLLRNINALKNDNVTIEEKIKALKLLYANLSLSEKTKFICKKLGILSALNLLLSNHEDNCVMNEYCSLILEKLCVVDEIVDMMDKTGTFQLLIKVIKRDSSDPNQKDKCAACSCIQTVASKFTSSQILLNQRRIIDDLVSVLNEPEKCNERLIFLIIDSLRLLTGSSSKGRNLAAKAGIISTIEKILNRDDFKKYELTIKTACRLIWNVTLDGEGKILGKDIILTLCKVLKKSIEYSNIQIQRYATGALQSILVYEKAKPITLQQFEPNYTPVDLLVNLLSLPKLSDDIEQNTIRAIRLLSEYPEARTRVKNLLNKELFSKVLFKFKLINW